MNKRDFRQLLLIRSLIEKFYDDENFFDMLVIQLEEIYRNLDEVNEEWSFKFFSEWEYLESIRSYMKDKGLPSLPKEYIERSIDALRTIETITLRLIEEDSLEEDADTVTVTPLDGLWLICPSCQEVCQFDKGAKITRCSKCYEKIKLIR